MAGAAAQGNASRWRASRCPYETSPASTGHHEAPKPVASTDGVGQQDNNAASSTGLGVQTRRSTGHQQPAQGSRAGRRRQTHPNGRALKPPGETPRGEIEHAAGPEAGHQANPHSVAQPARETGETSWAGLLLSRCVKPLPDGCPSCLRRCSWRVGSPRSGGPPPPSAQLQRGGSMASPPNRPAPSCRLIRTRRIRNRTWGVLETAR